jgi:hypothetical protein
MLQLVRNGTNWKHNRMPADNEGGAVSWELEHDAFALRTERSR